MQQTYFLGANTPIGFYSLFNELYNPYEEWNMYIIKGGPGTGKSTLMKNISAKAIEKDLDVDLIPCSSDPLSLDGIIIPELKTAICDGTSPHTVEPIFPGVCEHIVNLCECWNTTKLQENKSKIKMMTMTNKKAHQKSINYLKTAKIFEDEINNITKCAIKFDKVDRFTERLSQLKNNQEGNVITKLRFLSALSPTGISINYDTFINNCDTGIILKDNYNISHFIINEVAEKYNYNSIKYICPMNPLTKIDHIIYPDIKFGIFTSNKYHNLLSKNYKTISTDRFIDFDKINKHKKSIKFLMKSKNEMINEAISSLKTAKSTHDLLESYYIEAMNFNKINIIKENLIKEIFI